MMTFDSRWREILAELASVGQRVELIAISASGQTVSVLTHLRVARAAGARTAIVTTAGTPSLDGIADLRINLPIGATAVQSCQHGGSLFEQSSLILFDAIGALLQADLGLSNAQLTARHATLQ